MRMGQEFDLERLAEELQKLIDEEERAYYSPQVIQESHHPKNVGRMSDPDASAIVHGWCGDTMEIYLRVNDGRISEATFMTDGCGPTVACGSKLTSMVRGLPLDEAQEISRDDLLAALGGLPEESVHCAELAVNTLREAIASYRNKYRIERRRATWVEDSDVVVDAAAALAVAAAAGRAAWAGPRSPGRAATASARAAAIGCLTRSVNRAIG